MARCSTKIQREYSFNNFKIKINHMATINMGKAVNYPPTAEPMGWASRVNAPTNVGNLP